MEDHHPHEDQTLEQNTDELEEDVKSMAQKIAECRQTLPNQLTNTFSSIIASQRPANLTRINGDSDPGPSNNPNIDARTPLDSEGMVDILVEKNKTHFENVQMIKQKISGNASAEVLLLKRMKDIMSRIDKLDTFKQDMIHPAFTKKL